MSEYFKKINFNYIIICLIFFQILIFFNNSSKEINTFYSPSNSLENFTTMIAGEDGIDIITADKLIKLNSKKNLLLGEANLKNENYEISSSNVTVDSQNKTTSSSNKTTTTNTQGTITSEGFEYDQKSNIIKFNGESEFSTDDN
jgi:hypothetical protein